MMGDAAHACTPFIGNGAAQALEDATVLTELFGRCESASKIAKVLAVFESTRRERCTMLSKLARDFGRLYDFSLEDVWDNPTKMKEYLKATSQLTNEFDVSHQNSVAIAAFCGKPE
jgi:salicylate hydroxylase